MLHCQYCNTHKFVKGQCKNMEQNPFNKLPTYDSSNPKESILNAENKRRVLREKYLEQHKEEYDFVVNRLLKQYADCFQDSKITSDKFLPKLETHEISFNNYVKLLDRISEDKELAGKVFVVYDDPIQIAYHGYQNWSSLRFPCTNFNYPESIHEEGFEIATTILPMDASHKVIADSKYKLDRLLLTKYEGIVFKSPWKTATGDSSVWKSTGEKRPSYEEMSEKERENIDRWRESEFESLGDPYDFE